MMNFQKLLTSIILTILSSTIVNATIPVVNTTALDNAPNSPSSARLINTANSTNSLLIECTNRLNPTISDVQLVNNGTIQGCETTNGGNTISCTIKDAGEFRKKMTIQCSEEVKFCRSKRSINQDGETIQRTIMSASRCRAVEN